MVVLYVKQMMEPITDAFIAIQIYIQVQLIKNEFYLSLEKYLSTVCCHKPYRPVRFH